MNPTAATAHAHMEEAPATLAFETNVSEAIRTVDQGCFSGGDNTELILTTYSGKIIGYNGDIAAKDATGALVAATLGGGDDMVSNAIGLLKGDTTPKPVVRKELDAMEKEAVGEEQKRRFNALERDIE